MSGRILMTNFYFNDDPTQLPEYSESCHPVQIFNTHPYDSSKHSRVSGSLLKRVRELGISVDAKAIDLITIATAVTAAETFERRMDAADAWSRAMHLHIPVANDEVWNKLSGRLSSMLNFLTGDQWQFTFSKTSFQMPEPITSKKSKARLSSLKGLNSVCLFSGGLDSAVGAIDILNGRSSYKPLLLSHAYRGDGVKQSDIKKLLKAAYGELSYSISPRLMTRLRGKTDVTTGVLSWTFTEKLNNSVPSGASFTTPTFVPAYC